MNLFGPEHLFFIGLTAVLAVGIPWVACRWLPQSWQKRLGLLLASGGALAYFAWVGISLARGEFDPQTQLPLHLCYLANLLLPLAVGLGSRRLFEIPYYWGFAAGVQATITPAIDGGFQSLEFLAYFLQHNGMVIALIYGVVVLNLRPTPRGILTAMVAGNALLMVAIPVNYLLGSNYLFLCAKPQAASILDWCGDWPWYIVVGEGLALAHFALAYLPIWVLNLLAPADRQGADGETNAAKVPKPVENQESEGETR